jgi:hypothetical protein
MFPLSYSVKAFFQSLVHASEQNYLAAQQRQAGKFPWVTTLSNEEDGNPLSYQVLGLDWEALKLYSWRKSDATLLNVALFQAIVFAGQSVLPLAHQRLLQIGLPLCGAPTSPLFFNREAPPTAFEPYIVEVGRQVDRALSPTLLRRLARAVDDQTPDLRPARKYMPFLRRRCPTLLGTIPLTFFRLPMLLSGSRPALPMHNWPTKLKVRNVTLEQEFEAFHLQERRGVLLSDDMVLLSLPAYFKGVTALQENTPFLHQVAFDHADPTPDDLEKLRASLNSYFGLQPEDTARQLAKKLAAPYGDHLVAFRLLPPRKVVSVSAKPMRQPTLFVLPVPEDAQPAFSHATAQFAMRRNRVSVLLSSLAAPDFVCIKRPPGAPIGRLRADRTLDTQDAAFALDFLGHAPAARWLRTVGGPEQTARLVRLAQPDHGNRQRTPFSSEEDNLLLQWHAPTRSREDARALRDKSLPDHTPAIILLRAQALARLVGLGLSPEAAGRREEACRVLSLWEWRMYRPAYALPDDSAKEKALGDFSLENNMT